MSYKRTVDSAGVTVEHVPIDELKPGDVVIIGWRTTVARVEIEEDRCRIWWEGSEQPDQWNPCGVRLPREVV